MSLARDVAAFEGRCAAFAVSLAAVETALGRPAAAPFAPPPPAGLVAGGRPASAADVAAAATMLAAFTDALGGLERRVAILAEALAAFARLPPPAPVPGPAAPAGDLPPDDRLSRIALDRIQKQLVAGEDRLAGFELRVGAAEDALDAFFGTAS